MQILEQSIRRIEIGSTLKFEFYAIDEENSKILLGGVLS
jgi:hypothetical protein